MEIKMKDIEGFEGLYAVTADGNVWSYRNKKFLYISDNGQGYLFVTLCKDNKMIRRKIHSLVAQAFIPLPDWATPGMKLDVAHKDDNPSNNNVDNLAWMTRKENLDTDHFREAVKTKNFSKVKCVETGEIFDSCAAAGRAIGKNKYGINLCLHGKQKTCGGYHWERVAKKDKAAQS